MNSESGWLLVTLAIGAAIIVVPVVAWTVCLRRSRPRPWPPLVIAIATTIPLVTALTGTLATVMQVRSWRGEEVVDPSQKARRLGETISMAMNGTAFAVLAAMMVAVIVAVGVAIVSRSRRRRASG